VSQKTKIFPGVKRATEIVIESGKGCEVWTAEGKRYLDVTAGIGVLSTGHCHPTVVKAVQEQATKISHAQQSCYFNSTVNTLIDKLAPVVPPGHDSFFFGNSGAEAVEGAVRLARHATGRDGVIAFLGGYHGRTSQCLALTGSSSSYRGHRAGPLPGGTHWARYPYEHAGVTAEHALESLDLVLAQQAKASDIAAVIIEPVLGEGGYVVPPQGFMKLLRQWCSSNDFLLIADEVQSGFGRTGRQWAFEHFDIVPDILISAKGIASGYPLSMVTASHSLTSKQQAGCMGGTYGGNPVACAAALATLEVFQADGVLQNVTARGKQLMGGLNTLAVKPGSPIADVRGLGLMVGIEFDRDKSGIAAKVASNCFDRGVLILTTGLRESIRLIPPLIVKSKEIDEMLHVLDQAIDAAQA
jgi:4-aminobutyrate aminotransferase